MTATITNSIMSNDSNFPKLNKVLSAYEQLVQDAGQARPSLVELNDTLFEGFNEKSLIEISGVPNSGKSLLLWHLIARIISPTKFTGKNTDVVLIDCSHKFSTLHFLQQITNILSVSGEHFTKTDVQDCLKSVTMMSCYSGEEFDFACDALEDILWGNHKIALIAIDGLDAFYWLDVESQLVRMSTHYARMKAKLKKICEQHNVCFAYTVDSNYLETKKGSGRAASNVPYTKIDYKFLLDYQAADRRTLNGKSIMISDSGKISYA